MGGKKVKKSENRGGDDLGKGLAIPCRQEKIKTRVGGKKRKDHDPGGQGEGGDAAGGRWGGGVTG